MLVYGKYGFLYLEDFIMTNRKKKYNIHAIEIKTMHTSRGREWYGSHFVLLNVLILNWKVVQLMYHFVMQMLYVCVLCASCGSSQCCILHDFQFVNVGRRGKRPPYRRGILQGRSHGCLLSFVVACVTVLLLRVIKLVFSIYPRISLLYR